MAVQASEIKKLRTEQRNPATLNIDLLPTLDMVRMLNDQNRLVADAVDEQAGQIAAAVELITERMRKGGRLIYIGAGTSGRLGVMDASEIRQLFRCRLRGVVGRSPAVIMPFAARWSTLRMILWQPLSSSKIWGSTRMTLSAVLPPADARPT